MSKNIIGIFFFIIFFSKVQFAQDIYDLNKHLVQPEYSSFSGYDKPSTDANGNLNLSISLGEVQGRGINYPININYQSGIKVMQPSNWIGLGWNFNPGSITRVPVLGPQNDDPFNTDESQYHYGLDVYDHPDTEKATDEFIVSLPGVGSFEMVQIRKPNYVSSTTPVYETGDFVTIEHKAWKVEFQKSTITEGGYTTGIRADGQNSNESNRQDFSKFLITTDDGTRYLFSSPTLGYTDVVYYKPEAGSFPGGSFLKRQIHVNTWRLVAIFGNDYEGDAWSVPQTNSSGKWIKLTYHSVNTKSDNSNINFRQTQYLDEIITPVGKAEFVLQSRREPMLPEWERNSPNTAANATQKKLEAIIFYLGNNRLSATVLNHDNSFNPFLTNNTSDGRSKLTSIEFQGQTPYQELPGYSFTYVDNPSMSWPDYQNSNMQACMDFFGYYNDSWLGYTNETYKDKCNSSTPPSLNSGADSWSLSTIEYPSGLIDEIEYQTRHVASDTEQEYFADGWFSNDPQVFVLDEDAVNTGTMPFTYVGGPLIKSITRNSGFSAFTTLEKYKYIYDFKFPTLVGFPSAYLRTRFLTTETGVFSSQGIETEIYYQTLYTSFIGAVDNANNSTSRTEFENAHQDDIIFGQIEAAPCPLGLQTSQTPTSCIGKYYFGESLSKKAGKEIFFAESDSGYASSTDKYYETTFYGDTNNGPVNEFWTIRIQDPYNYTYSDITINQDVEAIRLNTLYKTKGESFTKKTYEYDFKTNLINKEIQHQTGDNDIKRVLEITRASEVYTDLKDLNMLTQIAREDIGQEIENNGIKWKSSSIHKWKKASSSTTNFDFWKPWISLKWKADQASNTKEPFSAWSVSSVPNSWIKFSERIHFDEDGNVKKELLNNGSSLNYEYAYDNTKLTKITLIENDNTNALQQSIEMWYDNDFRKTSKVKNMVGANTYYEYDVHGRLVEIKNHNNLLLSEYSYLYDDNYTFSSDYISVNQIIKTDYIYSNFEELTSSHSNKTYMYFDGIGRLRQEITEYVGGKYIVTQNDFNESGFNEKTWKPYLDNGSTGGNFIDPSQVRLRAKSYYKSELGLSSDPYPFLENEYLNLSIPVLSKKYPEWTSSQSNKEFNFSSINIPLVNGQSVRKIERIDESGNTVDEYYNHFGELVRKTVAENISSLNLETNFEYDEVGNLIKTISPKGLETTYTYNTLGQKTKESLPDQEGDKEYRYDDIGRLRFVQDPNQKSSKQDLSQSLYGGTSVTKNIFANSDGELSFNFSWVDLFMGNYTITIKRLDDNTTIYSNTLSSEGGSISTQVFNVGPGTYQFKGQAQDPGDIVSTGGTYGFESHDIFTYTKYDNLNRPIEIGQYSGGVSFGSANANEENFPISGHNPQINYYYDGDHPPLATGFVPNNAEGRLTKVSYRDQSTTSSWSHEGYSYNSLGLVEWKIVDLNSLSTSKLTKYKYDEVGKLIRTDYQPITSTDRFITWQEYDPYGRISYIYTSNDTLINNRTRDIEYVYSFDNSVKQRKLGNGSIQTVDYTYTIRGWLNQINNTSSIGTDKFAMKLGYAANGNITQQQWRQPQLNGYLATYNYTYDAASRIKTANFSGGGYNSYAFDVSNIAYDKNGNISGFIRNDQTGYSYPDGYLVFSQETNTNRLTNIQDQIDYINWDVDHDASGNMIKNQLNGLSSAQYDWRNLASQMIANGSTLFYAYDANGNRTKKKINSTETHYVRGMSGEVLAVYENDVIKMHNIYAGEEMIGNYDRSQRRYFLKDHLGSIRTTVDQNGAVDGYTDYYPFGKTMPGRSYTNQSTVLNANKYTGHERDEEANLTLDYMLARNYDPQIGRFLQVDPHYYSYPEWAPYTYTFNNPLIYTDPTGKDGDYFNEYGDHLGNDGIDDDKVYQTTDAVVAASEGDWNAVKSSDATSLIGYIGGEIDVSGMYPNLLDRNVSISKGIGPVAFRNLVKGGGDWDLKSNTNTIFGFASKKDANTRFNFNGASLEAQDIGNHHFGVVGKANRFPLFTETFMLRQAGQAQIAAGTSRPEWQINSKQPVFGRTGTITGYTKGALIPPYGDDPRDQSFIKQGFNYYKNKY